MNYISKLLNGSQARLALSAAIILTALATVLWAGGIDASVTEAGNAQEQGGQQPDAQQSDPEANLPYLFAVYIITWAGFFAYVFVMSRKQREMEREIAALRASLQDKGRPGPQ